MPALAALLTGQAASPVGAILSFDPEEGRRVFPGLEVTALTDPGTRAWARAAVVRALARYPAGALTGRLERVCVVDRLSFQGRGMSGTNDGRRIVLETGARGIDGAWLERALHHEFAHALQRSSGGEFPTREWRAANAPGFRYGTGGFAAVRSRRTGLRFNPALAAQGVLSVCGASSPGEDWATIAACVVTDDAEFWGLAGRYPRLRAKARLATAFYGRAFPGMRLREAAE